MTSNYYYLVSGLPDVLLDEGKQPHSCEEFAAEASEQLNRNDLALFNLFRLPFDNVNLLNLLEKKDAVFDKRGSLEEEVLSAALKIPDDLPVYMQLFIDAYRENRSPAPGLVPRDQLAWFFYEEMTCRHDPFIRKWYRFDLQLRNIIAGINCRREFAHLEELATERERAASVVVVGRDDVAEAVLRSNAPDFGLSQQLPWVERLVTLSRGQLHEFEKGIDTLRWDILDEMTLFSYFSAETVFAYFIKLTIVERWLALDPQTGKEQLDRLLDELKGSYTVPAQF
jgi:hypothetical protein